MEFSEILNDLLKRKAITAYKLSKETGISQSLIGYWKRGEKRPTAQNLQRLADYFQVSIDYLMTGKAKTPLSEISDEEADDELQGHRYALRSLDPDETGDLSLAEKRDVLKFIRFLKSQRIDHSEEGNKGGQP